MLVLLVIDLHQWLGVSWKKSFSLALETGIIYGILFGLILLLISVTAVSIAYCKVA